MSKIQLQIVECLKSLKSIKDAKEKIKAISEESLTEFETSLNTEVNETCKGYADLIAELVAGKESNKNMTDVDLFSKLQDESMELNDDNWDESTAKLFLASYLKNGGKIEVPTDKLEEKVLIKDLYNLEESNEFASTESYLTNQQRQNLPDTVFLGENKTIPITNKVDVLNYLFLQGKSEENVSSDLIKKVESVALDYGVLQEVGEAVDGKFTTKIYHCPITVLNKESNQVFFPIKIENEEEAKEALELLETISVSYNFSETQKKQVQDFIEEVINEKEFLFNKAPLFNLEKKFTANLTLGTEFLFNSFVKAESNVELKSILSKLVGIARRNEISLEALEEAGKAYSIFGVRVLKKLLSTPTVPKTESAKVEMIPSPLGETSPVTSNETTSLEEQEPKLISLVDEFAATDLIKKAKGASTKSNSRR
jgi:hypothetical protein